MQSTTPATGRDQHWRGGEYIHFGSILPAPPKLIIYSFIHLCFFFFLQQIVLKPKPKRWTHQKSAKTYTKYMTHHVVLKPTPNTWKQQKSAKTYTIHPMSPENASKLP